MGVSATEGSDVPATSEPRPSGATAALLEQLRLHQDQLSLMAEWLPQLVWTTRADGTPDWYNRRWYEFTGMPSDDGRALDQTPYDWTEYVHPDDRDRVVATWKEASEASGLYECRYRLRHVASGDHRWVLARGQPLRDESGQIVRWFGTCTDIHEQMLQAEHTRRLESAATQMLAAATVEEVVRAAIHESKDAIGASSCAINLYDEATRTLRVAGVSDDPAGRASLTWGPIPVDARLLVSTAARTRQTQFLVTDADFSRTSEQAASALRALGIGSAAFCPMYVGDRLIGTIGFSFASPSAFSEEQVRFMEQLAAQCAHAIDRARLFEQARDARAEAERANRAKSEFLAVMSHELRSPLNAIDGHASLLEDGIHGPVNDQQVSAIHRIRRSSRILLGLISDLLDFARIEAGKVHYDLRTVSVHQLLRDVQDLVVPQLGERRLAFEVAAVAPEISVTADPDKARQILLNLVTNAMKFTSDGGRIAVTAAGGDASVSIQVSDTGIGIPEDKLPQVFDPFMQVDKSHRRQAQGVGLGLAISRDLARGMGGELSVTSELGKGSTFTLTLPKA